MQNLNGKKTATTGVNYAIQLSIILEKFKELDAVHCMDRKDAISSEDQAIQMPPVKLPASKDYW